MKKVRREVANLIERKNLHNTKYGVKEYFFHSVWGIKNVCSTLFYLILHLPKKNKKPNQESFARLASRDIFGSPFSPFVTKKVILT